MKTSNETKTRLAEIKAMLGNTRRLTSKQYREMLEEIQANVCIHLLENTLLGFAKDSGAYTMILEKVHWLLDSAKGSSADQTQGKVITVKFMDPPEEKKSETA